MEVMPQSLLGWQTKRTMSHFNILFNVFKLAYPLFSTFIVTTLPNSILIINPFSSESSYFFVSFSQWNLDYTPVLCFWDVFTCN